MEFANATHRWPEAARAVLSDFRFLQAQARSHPRVAGAAH